MKLTGKHILPAVLALLFCSVPFTVHAALEEEETRDWQDEQVYSIMVDRFNNGDPSNDDNIDIQDPEAFQGGDLQGIIDELDEIKESGFTAIQLTPIMDNAEGGYHGYWVEDFMAVEEHFGTLEDAKQLVEEAHEREMKVIFDFVTNHTAPAHPWLEEEGRQDWFHQEQNGNKGQEAEWIDGLPDLNQSNPEVREYLFEAAAFWINETGVDGFRLSDAAHVPKTFWKDFSDHVKKIDPEFFLLGEIESGDPAVIASYQETGIDGFVDYPFYETAVDVFADTGTSLEPLFELWETNRKQYENPKLLATFLDNRNTERFTRVAVENQNNPVTRWKLAFTYLFTAPGIPLINQGSEVPVDGGEPPDNRPMIPINSVNEELQNHLESLSSIVQRYPAIKAGDFELIDTEGAMSLYSRTFQGESVYVAINNDTETKTVSVSDLDSGLQLRGLLLDNTVRQQQDGEWKIALDRETSEIFIVEEDTGINWLFVGFLVAVMGLFVFSVIYLSRKNRVQAKKMKS